MTLITTVLARLIRVAIDTPLAVPLLMLAFALTPAALFVGGVLLTGFLASGPSRGTRRYV
jgi:hypothetical protein